MDTQGTAGDMVLLQVLLPLLLQVLVRLRESRPSLFKDTHIQQLWPNSQSFLPIPFFHDAGWTSTSRRRVW